MFIYNIIKSRNQIKVNRFYLVSILFFYSLNCFSQENKPFEIILNEKNIYSVFNDESLTSYFSYLSLLNDNFFSFYSEDPWDLINYYNFKKSFYFEFSSNSKIEEKKYIRVTLPGL